jgi:hypothetical protein
LPPPGCGAGLREDELGAEDEDCLAMRRRALVAASRI